MTTEKPETPTKKRRVPKGDALLVEAVEVARTAIGDIARPGEIGEHVAAIAQGERLVAHQFECRKAGYLGWLWVATLARIPRGRKATVCEIGIVPGEGALMAPPWIPWEERIKPGDIGRDDVLPYRADDDRLVEPEDPADTAQAIANQPGASKVDPRDADKVAEPGIGRPRVLTTTGRDQAAERWYSSEQGPVRNASPRGQTCSSCGFLLKMAGSMRTVFGVCANEWSPDDGRVVSLDHSCGAHSETEVPSRGPAWPIVPPRLDECDLEIIPHD